MNRSMKALTLGLLAFALAAVVVAVSPQLMAARSPNTDANAPADAVASTSAQSGMVDGYNWRVTASPRAGKGF